jgi:tetratricopeptide (TPR) repeat protein
LKIQLVQGYSPENHAPSYSLGAPAPTLSRDFLIDETTATWLRPLETQPSLDFLMASQFFQPAFVDSSGQGLLTRELLQNIRNFTKEPSNRCPGLADVWKSLQSSDVLRDVGQQPFFFSTSGAKPAFCFAPGSTATLNLHSKVDSNGQSTIIGHLPMSVAAAQLKVTVNQILVLQRPLTSDELTSKDFTIQIPAPLGRNICQVVVQIAGQPLFADSLELNYWQRISAFNSLKSAHRPVITIQQPAIYDEGQDDATVDVQADPTVDIQCVVHLKDEKDAVFEVRNNGVPLVRKLYVQRHATSNFQSDQRIVLMSGDNNIEVEVNSGGVISNKRLVLRHRTTQHIVAVLIGIGKYEDPAIPELSFPVSDVSSVRRLLLSYSEISPADIIELQGAAATKAAILDMLSGSALEAAIRQQGSTLSLPDTTVIVYYSGYGVTLTGADSLTRCLVPYDAKSKGLTESCISTTYVDQILDKAVWPNTMLIMDTSYDGPAGLVNSPKDRLFTRTLTNYRSSETGWRLLSGVSDGRQFLVAGGTNEPALESSRLQHGALTYGLLNAFSAFSQNTQLEFSLPNLYERIGQTVASSTDDLENPVLKGTLSSPMEFRFVSLDDLRDKWRRKLTKAKRDSVSMLRIDLSDLNDSKNAFDKADELFPNERAITNGKALISKYLGALNCKKDSVDECEHYAKSIALLSKALDDPTMHSSLSQYQGLDLYESELDLAIVYFEMGKFQDAIVHAKNAISANPKFSLRARFTDAKALLAAGHAKEAATALDDVLGMDPAFGPPAQLSAEEWGKAVVWRAILLRADGKDIEEKLLLEKYARGDTKTASLFTALGSPFAWGLRGLKGNLGNPAANMPSVWSNEIANYLLGKRGNGDELENFIKDPRRDTTAIECEAQYYIGIYKTWNQKSDANENFRTSAGTKLTDHVEYWLAKLQIPKRIVH